MEKWIARVSYWLGIISLVLALILRIVWGLGWGLSMPFLVEHSIGYTPFLHGTVIFLLATVASAAYSWMKERIS